MLTRITSVLDPEAAHISALRRQADFRGRVLCEIHGEPLFRLADAAAAAVDAAIAEGRLLEEAVDDHDVRKHYRVGADLVDDFAGKERQLPVAAIPVVRAVTRPCIVRERCRLRRLRLAPPAGCVPFGSRLS